MRNNRSKVSKLVSLIFIVLAIAFILIGVKDSSKAANKNIIATVGNKDIYLKDIQIKNIDMDMLQKEQYEKLKLMRLIMKTVQENEMKKRDIEVPFDEIESEAKKIAGKNWKMLGKTEEDREDIIDTIKYKMGKVSEAISIWKDNKTEGDRFAKEELRPLGIDTSIWEWIKIHCDEPEKIKLIEEAKNYDKDKYMKLFYKTAENKLRIEKLKEKVIPEISIRNRELKKLFELTNNVDRLEVITIHKQNDLLQEVREGLLQKDHEIISNLDKYQKIIISGSDFNLDELNNPNRNILFLLSIYCPTISSDYPSKIFDWISDSSNDKLILYIVNIKKKKNISEFNYDININLKNKLINFKREYEYQLWLWKKMKDETIINEPRYKDIFK